MVIRSGSITCVKPIIFMYRENERADRLTKAITTAHFSDVEEEKDALFLEIPHVQVQ